MPTFSFDIVSEIDKAEMNNVFLAAQKDIQNRYDFKNTPAEVSWLDDKKGFIVVGSNEWQIDAIIDIIRKRLASREISSKVLDLSKAINVANLKATKQIPFISGLDQDKAKKLSSQIRQQMPKLKPQIQGEALRITGSSKDELQNCITFVRSLDLDYIVQFINYR